MSKNDSVDKQVDSMLVVEAETSFTGEVVRLVEDGSGALLYGLVAGLVVVSPHDLHDVLLHDGRWKVTLTPIEDDSDEEVLSHGE